MGGVTIGIRLDDARLRGLLGDLARRAGDLTPAMKIIGATVQASVKRNFEEGGRPEKWRPSRKEGGKTLIGEGHLMGSITYRAASDHVVIGTNRKYAAIHHFGGEIKPRHGKFLVFVVGGRKIAVERVVIPARPYMMVQDEDWDEIRHALGGYLMRGRG